MTGRKFKIPYFQGLQLAVRWLAFAYLFREVILSHAALFGASISTAIPIGIVVGHAVLASLILLLLSQFSFAEVALVILDLAVGISLLFLYQGDWTFVLPLFLATYAGSSISWAMALTTSISTTVLYLAENIFRLGLSQEILYHPDWLLLLVLNLALSTLGLFKSESERDRTRRDSLIALIESGQELGSTLSFDNLFKLDFELAKSMFSATTCVIYMKNAQGVLEARSAQGPYAKFFHDFNPAVVKSTLTSLIRDKQAQVYQDVQSLSELDEQVLPKVKSVRAGMAVPLVFEGEAIGLLFAASELPNIYDGETLRMLIVLANQTAVSLRNVQLHAATKEMAITDSVSGLYTHSYMQEVLDREFRRCKYAKLPLSTIIIDVDFFKVVNDTYGHPQGDSLLRQLGGVIKSVTRANDTVCRYGGDEFMVILPETARVGAVLVAERIRQAVQEYEFVVGSKVIHIAVSGGVASFPEDIETKKELIDTSDQALYRAKKEGRNKICFGAG